MSALAHKTGRIVLPNIDPAIIQRAMSKALKKVGPFVCAIHKAAEIQRQAKQAPMIGEGI